MNALTVEEARSVIQGSFSDLVQHLHAKDIAGDLLTENIIDFDVHCDLLAASEEEANILLVTYFCKRCTPVLLEHFVNVLGTSSTRFSKHADLVYKLQKGAGVYTSKRMRESKVIDSAFAEIQGNISLNLSEVKEVEWNVAGSSTSNGEDSKESTDKGTHLVLPTFEQIKSSSQSEEKASDELDKAIDQIVEKLKTKPQGEYSPQISSKPVGFGSDPTNVSSYSRKGPSSIGSARSRVTTSPSGSPGYSWTNNPLSKAGVSHSGVKAPKKVQVNLLLLGDSRVGKSALRKQYVHKQFLSTYKATGGCDYLSRDLILENKNVLVKVWDSMGSVKYRAMAYTFYSAADACILVFDLTKPSSFESLEKWRTTFLEQTGSDTFPFVVLGNKTDLVKKAEKQVDTERVRAWCESMSLPYFETSAQDEVSVEMAFVGTTRFVIDWMSGKRTQQQLKEAHSESGESTAL